MALRSVTRIGGKVGGRVVVQGRGSAAVAQHVGAERRSSSWVGQGQGQGQFGRSQAPPCRQGSLGSHTQLFKLVETDLMSKELTRYGPSDAEHLGLHSIQDVLSDIAAATSALPKPVVSSTAAPTEMEDRLMRKDSTAPVALEEKVLAAWGLSLRAPDTSEEEELKAPAKTEEQEKMAIKRTYQPSTLKRKRRHGYLYRAKTRLGKKILQRRQDKGRWRLGI